MVQHDNIDFVHRPDIFEALHNIFNLLKSKQGKQTSITKTEISGLYSKLFVGDLFSEQDSQEFVNPILDGISSFLEIKLYNNPFTYDLVSVLECLSNTKKSTKSETQTMLQLMFDKYDDFSHISDLINNLQTPEQIEYLASCDYNTGIKQLLVKNTSKYLLIFLKRFAHLRTSTNTGRKLSNQIYPDHTLNIDGKEYRLKSCVIQLGEINSGHYVYLNFNESGDPLFVISDSTVQTYASYKVDYLGNGYIYLYELLI